MNTVLILKLMLVPSLIAGVTLAGRRWGPAVAGWLSAFPIVSAPILYFIALERGAPFTAQAAVGTLSAVLANLAFGISYAWSATRFSWVLSLLAGFVSYFTIVAGLRFLAPSLYLAAFIVLAALLLAPRFYPVLPMAVPSASKPGNDMVWRMGAGALLVLLVTHFSAALGPNLSGLFAMFPVMGSVLAVFSHRTSGAAFAMQMLRGMVLGYYSFSVFCITLSLSLPSLGIGVAFAVALTAAVLIQAISRMLLQRSAG
jgi:hypothetical protein